MKKHNTPIIIILIGILLRLVYLYFFKDNTMNWDELFPMAFSLSCNSYFDLVKKLALEDCHPPLFVLISRFFISLGDDRFFLLRTMNVFFSSLNLFFFYQMMKRYSKNKKIVIMSLVFMSLSPWMLKESIRVFRYTTFLTFVLLSYISFFDLYHKRNKKNTIFYIISTLLCFYTHYYALFVFLPQFILGLSKRSDRKNYFFVDILIVVFYLPFLLYSNSSPLNPNFYKTTLKGSIGWLVPVDFSKFFTRMLTNYLVYDLNLFVDLIGILVAVILIYTFIKSDRFIKMVLFLPPVLLTITAFIFQFIFKQGLVEYNHFVFTIPLFFYSLGVFFCHKKRSLLIPILITIFIFSISLHLLNNTGDMFDLFVKDILAKHADSKTMVYIFPAYYFINVRYYLSDFPTKINVIPLDFDLESLKRSFQNKYYNKRIFFVRNMTGESLHHGKINKLLDYLRSRKDLLSKTYSNQVSLFFQPYDKIDKKTLDSFSEKGKGRAFFIMSITESEKLLTIILCLLSFFSLAFEIIKERD